MKQIAELYPYVLEQTKKKVLEELDRYLGTKEVCPTLKQFLAERSEYLNQIWVNVWINHATNKVAKKEKKAFLREQGYEVEGVDKKLMNKLFRSEIKSYHPFDASAWVASQTVNLAERYKQARKKWLKQQEENRIRKQREQAETAIKQAGQAIINRDQTKFYVVVRSEVANQFMVKLNEEQIEWHETVVGFQDRHQVSTYRYEAFIAHVLTEQVSPMILEQLSPELLRTYANVYHNNLSQENLKFLLSDQLAYLQMVYLSNIETEYVSDLYKLASIPYDEALHLQLLEHDRALRERRKQEQLDEIKRKKQEEAKMLVDIFGHEYQPGLERTIRYVLHIGETNTGKTHQALTQMKKASSGLYLAPLRLLALEVFDTLNNEGVPCALKTGEEEKNVQGASHISCTVEMFHEKDFYEVVVIDEAQMIADKDRGFSWYKAITKANANEVHIICSRNARQMILELLGDAELEIIDYQRDIPLEVESKAFHIHHIKKGDALVCFSRRRVLETASKLQHDGKKVSMIYGSMPPETRKKQMQRFIKGETTVIVATDAIGMGLNLPIRRIVFLENEKFDGVRRRRLTSQEVKQIAGRAGRKGLYNIGKVSFMEDQKAMDKLLNQDDPPIQTFAIAPTTTVLERFQKYSRDLGMFFELWHKFQSPNGTKKAALIEEQALYQTIRGTDIEARLPLMDLYSFLHLPFSTKEPALIKQWTQTMKAIVNGHDLPEPIIKRSGLEELELAYKAVGLHLLFLYKLEQRTIATYWEKIREEISDEIHEILKTDVKNFAKKCKHCGKKLAWNHKFPMCEACHFERFQNREYDYFNRY